MYFFYTCPLRRDKTISQSELLHLIRFTRIIIDDNAIIIAPGTYILVVQCTTHFRCLGRVRYVPGDVRIRRPVFRYQRAVFPRRHASPSVQPSLLLRGLRLLIDPEELRCLASNVTAKFNKDITHRSQTHLCYLKYSSHCRLTY